MPGLTPNRAYPFPLLSETQNFPTDIQNLATAIDADVEALDNAIQAAYNRDSVRVVGPVGGRFRVESTTLLGVDWRTEESIGVIETQGDQEPVVVPLPMEDVGEFRQFRLRKE